MDAIRLVINGQDLDLSPGFTVLREEESSIFNRELDRKDFTYPANIPLTEKNDQIMGFISNLAVGEKKKEFLADFYFNEVYDNQVTVRVLNVSTITQTIEISIIGTYGTFARIVGSKKLANLLLDGDRVIGTTSGTIADIGMVHYEFETDFPGYPASGNFMELTTKYYDCNTAAHMKSVMLGSVSADYCFYPSLDNKANIEKLNDDGKSLINFYDWDSASFVDPIIELYRAKMKSNANLQQRHFWVPQFKALYVLRKCFEESGFKVTGDIFSNANFQKATLYNTTTFCNYKFEETEWDSVLVGDVFGLYKTVTITNQSTVIHPQDHMPDITIIEFINELAKAWNLQYRIDLKLRTVNIVQLKTFKNSVPVLDFSSKAYPVYEAPFEENDLTDGYSFEFDLDAAESFLSSQQKDELGEYPVVASVDKLSNLTGTYSVYDLAYIRRENAYYQYGGSNWFFYSYNAFAFNTIEDAKNPITIKTKVIPLINLDQRVYRTGLNGDGNVVPVDKTIFMPVSTIGIEGTNQVYMVTPKGSQYEILGSSLMGIVNSAPINIQPIVVNYHGLLPNADLTAYPFGSSISRDPNGVSITGINHFWECPDHTGLFYNQWKAWTDSLVNSIPVKYDMLFTGVTEDMVDYESNILFIHGQQYVVKKSSKPLPFPCVANFELIRI